MVVSPPRLLRHHPCPPLRHPRQHHRLRCLRGRGRCLILLLQILNLPPHLNHPLPHPLHFIHHHNHPQQRHLHRHRQLQLHLHPHLLSLLSLLMLPPHPHPHPPSHPHPHPHQLRHTQEWEGEGEEVQWVLSHHTRMHHDHHHTIQGQVHHLQPRHHQEV